MIEITVENQKIDRHVTEKIADSVTETDHQHIRETDQQTDTLR